MLKFCKFCRLAMLGSLCWKLGILKEGSVGNEGEKFEKLGISKLEMPKLRIWGIEKPSKLSSPAKGDCIASLGLSSEDELEPSEEEGDDDDETGDESGDRLSLCSTLLCKFI